MAAESSEDEAIRAWVSQQHSPTGPDMGLIAALHDAIARQHGRMVCVLLACRELHAEVLEHAATLAAEHAVMAGFAGGAPYRGIEEGLRRWPHDAALRDQAHAILRHAQAQAAAPRQHLRRGDGVAGTCDVGGDIEAMSSPDGADSPAGDMLAIPSFMGMKALPFRSQVRGLYCLWIVHPGNPRPTAGVLDPDHMLPSPTLRRRVGRAGATTQPWRMSHRH